MSRRRNPRRPADPESEGRKPIAGRSTFGASAGLLPLVVSILVVARYFLPAESAALGETLWVVQLWFIAGVFWLWLTARSGRRLRRLDGLDWGLGLLIGGHVLSAIVVLSTEGDRRAALNMLWEWLAIGVSALMIRETVSGPFGRSRLLSVLVISTVTLSGLGLWQHYVWYPQVSSMLSELKQLSLEPASDPGEIVSRERRKNELSRDLGLPSHQGDPGATKLLHARIEDSTEPIGRFALANTFAGLLLIGLFLGIGSVLQKRSIGPPDWRLWSGLVLTTMLGYCFWLTKSRTAWVGLAVGLLVWGVLTRQKQYLGTKRSRIGGVFILLLIGLPVIASLLGGLDREVITESPKSMQYRLEYWSATGGVIRDHFLIGVGPGNFRQAYLKHKLPGSSEEILDPHNLFLDVWANGGLIALVGLITILMVAGKATLQIRQRQHDSAADVETRWSAATFLWRGLVGGLALVVAALAELFNGVGMSTHTWWLLMGWCGVSLFWPTVRWDKSCRPPLAAAMVALVVHLMGAGGIAMPAILQTLIILAACVVSEARPLIETSPNPSPAEDAVPWRAMAGTALCLCLAMACAFTATLPVSAATAHIQVGRGLMTQATSLKPAMNSFGAAIEADPLAAQPWQEFASAMMIEWSRTMGTDDESFTDAVLAQQEAIRRNPHSAYARQMLGRMWWRHYETKQDLSDADRSLQSFRKAVERYPHQATLQMEFAKAAETVDRMAEARQAAAFALELDDLNRKHGHIDKYLPDTVREWAATIIEQGL